MELAKTLGILPESYSTFLECRVGSSSRGANSDNDIFGVFTPPKEQLKNLSFIIGYDEPQFPKTLQKHKITFENQEYDFQFTTLTHFFKQLEKSNPNALEVLFSNAKNILFASEVGRSLVEQKHLFLTQNCYKLFLGFSKSMFFDAFKITEARKDIIAVYGYDIKAAHHCARILEYLFQISKTQTFDPTLCPKAIDIKAGKLTKAEFENEYNWLKDSKTVLQVESKLTPLPVETDRRYILSDLIDRL